MTFQNIRDLLLKVIELKRGQKSQRTQVECHDRWHRLLEQERSVEQRPVASKTDDEIDLVRQVVSTISGKQNCDWYRCKEFIQKKNLLERYELILDFGEIFIPRQLWIIQNGCLYPYDHVLLVNEPLNQLNERLQHL